MTQRTYTNHTGKPVKTEEKENILFNIVVVIGMLLFMVSCGYGAYIMGWKHPEAYSMFGMVGYLVGCMLYQVVKK
jgi:hypothetical protein|nr:MAG TPA: Protein of unknown function (DUF2583) [Bacteriophage sp.]